MKFKIIMLGVVVSGLSACASTKEKPAVAPVVVAPQAVVQAKRPYNPNMEEIFSNESVIYYPLDKSPASVKQKFPEYRSVLDNTTAGGYTVFDPSVTVYALNNNGGKPDYLPAYSVPQYAAQYKTDVKIQEQKAAAIIPPLPQSYNTPRAPLTSPAPAVQQQRRSRPVLTGY